MEDARPATMFVGGGFKKNYVSDASTQIVASVYKSYLYTGQGWEVFVHNPAYTTITTYAICAKVS
jgi:hypothetical protein